MSDKNNPFAAAAQAYGNTANIEGGRELEGKILLKAATQLELLQKRLEKGEKVPSGEAGETLEYNQKLWQFFVNAMKNEEHPLPREIKNNIATLGLFVFKRTLEVMIDTKPGKIQALIEINRNIAAGLMTKPKAEPQPQAALPGAKSGPAHPYGKKQADQSGEKQGGKTTTDSVV